MCTDTKLNSLVQIRIIICHVIYQNCCYDKFPKIALNVIYINPVVVESLIL